jgi:membrane associated rhomboid family serine protease
MVLPVSDTNPTRRRAWVTGGLVVANVAAYLLLFAPLEGCAARAFLFEWAAVPQEVLSFRQLGQDQLATAVGPGCAATVGGKSVLASVVTAMFLHANLAHLGGNMLFLWVFGNNIEDRLGHLRFVLFYVVGGVVATYVFAFLNAGSLVPLLGASGAVAAILGAYLVMHPRAIVHAYAPFPV